MMLNSIVSLGVSRLKLLVLSSVNTYLNDVVREGLKQATEVARKARRK